MPKYINVTNQGTYAKEARDSLVALIRHVFACRGDVLVPVTYQDLASRIGRINKHGIGHGHGMGQVLGVMGHLLEDIDGDWGEGIPKIQALVVNKSGPLSGLPDSGIEEFWPRYKSMTKLEKARHARFEQIRVAEFGSRWNQGGRKRGHSVILWAIRRGLALGFGVDGSGREGMVEGCLVSGELGPKKGSFRNSLN